MARGGRGYQPPEESDNPIVHGYRRAVDAAVTIGNETLGRATGRTAPLPYGNDEPSRGPKRGPRKIDGWNGKD